MRWDHLGESRSAPFGTDIVSRTIDTPECRGITGFVPDGAEDAYEAGGRSVPECATGAR
ncbi:hypothetical protein [Streptomyces sp. NPDC054765]